LHAYIFLVPGASDGVWTMVFCPIFFESPKLRYLEERSKGSRDTVSSIALLTTYEHAIAHEFMHVDIFKYRGPHSKSPTVLDEIPSDEKQSATFKKY
jgi:hypothetical protein